MDSERVAAFIHSLELPESPQRTRVRREAVLEGVPVIRPETGSLLSFFVSLLKPRRILEVGTGTGYSSLVMREAMPEDGQIDTIDNYPPRIEKAKDNIKKAGEEGHIRLIEGDAAEVLKTLQGPYDFIFMDAAKGQYIHFLPEVLRILPSGGVLFSDNVLQDGDVLQSRFAVDRRDRTIHARMREYLYVLKHTDGLVTSVIPIGDGAAVTVKLDIVK